MHKEHEALALDIMTILKRTGNEWRKLSYAEYCEEIRKDGNRPDNEQWFNEVVEYTHTAVDAKHFAPTWKQIYNRLLSESA